MSSTKGSNATKDVIYIDVDDEITAIIDKVKDSDKKIVALVLPKRAAVLQSIVNMKLLKRATTEAKKNLVLITSESGLLPLAGTVGLHVAKSLNTKPEVPESPTPLSAKPDVIDEVDEDLPLDSTRTVGELSGLSASTEDDETIELDDEEPEGAESTNDGKAKKFKNRKFKIPNFNKFRVLLLLSGVGVLLLVMVGYAAVVVWPKAKITIKTNSEAVDSSVVLTLKTGADTKLDAEKAIIKAQIQEVKKTITQDVPTTGQQNNGEKATGTVEMTTKDCSAPYSVSAVAAGTGVSANGRTYITDQKANFSPTTFDFGTSCWNYKASGIGITAQSGGAASNTGSATFTVSGRSDVTATGSASGGTDNIVKVVSQADIDSAKQKITEQDTKPIALELKNALIGRSLYAMDSTLSVGAPETKLSAELNAPADTLTVTQTINYSMFGVMQTELEQIIEASVKDKVDTNKQTITDFGLDEAVFSIQGVTADGASVSMQATVVAGADLNPEAIKKQVAGKKAGGAKDIIMANPGVTDVNVEYSPFWVGAIPKRIDKITVVIQQPKASTNEQSSP